MYNGDVLGYVVSNGYNLISSKVSFRFSFHHLFQHLCFFPHSIQFLILDPRSSSFSFLSGYVLYVVLSPQAFVLVYLILCIVRFNNPSHLPL